jgi:hypothetical protein
MFPFFFAISKPQDNNVIRDISGVGLPAAFKLDYI